MRFIKLVLLLSILTPLILAEGDCRGFVQQLPSQRSNQNVPYKQYFESSGVRGRFDIGNKTRCELNDQMKYFVIVHIDRAGAQSPGGWLQQETGICVPEYCTQEMLNNDKGLLRQLAQTNNWNIGGELILHDPNGTSPRGKLYYGLIYFFYVLVGLCIASTIVQGVTKLAVNAFSKGTTKKDYSVWLFKSFDLVGNLKNLWMTAEESGQSDHISTFGFLRIFAIIWVLAFHEVGRDWDMVKNHNVQSSNPELDAFIMKGDLGPGYFFFMGGFLAIYTVASKASRDTGSGLIGFFSDIWHRFLKIYPGVCVAIFFYWIVMPGLLNGPLWGRYFGAISVCDERWQNKFLLKDNFDMPIVWDWCASWTWYIDVDFQVYPVVVFIGYVFIQNKLFKYVAYLGLIALGYLSYQNGLDRIHAFERINQPPYWNWYTYPQSRAFEIFIGAFFGMQYYEYAKLKLKSNFVAWCEKFGDLRYVSVVAGAYINYYCIFTPFNTTGWSANEWLYVKRLYMGVGTGLFFMPLANDAPSILKAFMNLRIFQILGKLCFGVYLLHWPLQLAYNYTSRTVIDNYDHNSFIYKVKLNILHSFAAAFVYYLVLEKPLLNIEAHFTKRQKPVKADAVAAETAAPSAQYKVISEVPDQDQDISIADQSSFMEASMRDESPVYYDNRSVRSVRIESPVYHDNRSVRSPGYPDNQSMRSVRVESPVYHDNRSLRSIRVENPGYPENQSVRSMKSTKSTRSTRQVGDTISIVHDVEMGKFDHYDDREVQKPKHFEIR